MVRRLLAVSYLLSLSLLLVPQLLFAQDAPPDLKQVAVDSINALITPLTVVVLWALKTLWGKIPASLVLFLAPVVGMALNFALAKLASNPPADPVIAALLGAVGTYGREFLDTVINKGFAGSITTTKLNF